MITVTLDAGAVADNLAALPGRADDAIGAVSVDLAGRLRAIAERNLSGDVLNARSGKLRESLAASVDLTSRIAATVTADTPYAAFQEYGFDGVETVRAHLPRPSAAPSARSRLRCGLTIAGSIIPPIPICAAPWPNSPPTYEPPSPPHSTEPSTHEPRSRPGRLVRASDTVPRRDQRHQDGQPPPEIPAGYRRRQLTVDWTGMQPLKRIMHLDLVLYAHSGDRSFPTSSLLSPLLDAIEQSFGASDPDRALTLGGLARRVTINGRIETDEGLLGEYAYAVVPVDILIP
jgi:hypothetical protein